MSLKFIPFLILVSVLSLSECQDWCNLMAPDGYYIGLGVYHRWNSQKERDSDFVMFNRGGHEWTLRLVGVNEPEIKNMTLQLIEDSLTEVYDDSRIVNQFGAYYIERDFIERLLYLHSYDCIVYYLGGTKYDTYCVDRAGTSNYPKTQFPYYSKFIVMRRRPSGEPHMLVVNKENQTQFSGYDIHHDKVYEDSAPLWVKNMNHSLFKRIDGVFDFNYGSDRSGWVVLFNTIDGTPKYCIVKEDRDMAEECESDENLKPFYEECFPAIIPLPTPKPIGDKVADSTLTTESDVAIIVTIVITTVVVILLLIVCLVLDHMIKRRALQTQKKKEKDKPSVETFWVTKRTPTTTRNLFQDGPQHKTKRTSE